MMKDKANHSLTHVLTKWFETQDIKINNPATKIEMEWSTVPFSGRYVLLMYCTNSTFLLNVTEFHSL